MKALVLNFGSSSLKFKAIETAPDAGSGNRDRTRAHGLIERTGHEVTPSFWVEKYGC